MQPTESTPNVQFDLVTILSWTAVIAMHLTALPSTFSVPSIGDLFGMIVFWGILFIPASTCIPMLVRRLQVTDGHILRGYDRLRFILLVCVYSMLSLMLATIAFEPDWKGAKGMHWFYYTLDGWAGLTLWPIYAVSVVLLTAPAETDSTAGYDFQLIASITLTAISLWYTFAVLALNFAGPSAFWIVPGSCAICYFLYSCVIIKNRAFAWKRLALPTCGWIAGLVTSIIAKFPLATRAFADLPDEPPSCFVVTAASHGHRTWVGAWYDSGSNRWLNNQLLTFWHLERQLMRHVPKFHRALRFVYNRVGPTIAGKIRYRWQADAVYVLLKPLEILSRILLRLL